MTPKTEWELLLTPEIDGHPFAHSRWTRVEGWLPVLENTYTDGQAFLRLEAAGAQSAAVIRLELTNPDQLPHTLRLRCEKPGAWNGYNPAWVQPDWDRDVLLAGWNEQADRVLVLALGGDAQRCSIRTPFAWTGPSPGRETPGLAHPPLPRLPVPASRRSGRRTGKGELEAAKEAWRRLLARAAQVSIPDPGVQQLSPPAWPDCFRDARAGRRRQYRWLPRTEIYRAPSCFEPLILSILLDQVGLHAEAAGNILMCVEQQAADGNWGRSPRLGAPHVGRLRHESLEHPGATTA